MKRKAVWVLAVVALVACGFLSLRALGTGGEVVTSSEIIKEGSRPMLKVKLSNHSLRSVLLDVTPGTLFGTVYVLMEDGSYKRFVTEEFDQKLLFDKGVATRMTLGSGKEIEWRVELSSLKNIGAREEKFPEDQKTVRFVFCDLDAAIVSDDPKQIQIQVARD
jgi:hypothetical protein